MPGKVIKHLRLKKNVSQKYIALRLNMSIGNYSRLENDMLPISIERLHIIAETLQVKPFELIYRNKEDLLRDIADFSLLHTPE